MTRQVLVVMLCDAQGLPRAYATGAEAEREAVAERARAHLLRRCARLGHDPRDYRCEVEVVELAVGG